LNELEKLRDIKPIVDIPDYSFFFFCAIVVFIAIALFLISYSLFRYFKNKKPDQKKISLKVLKELDFSDAKKSAYLITLHTRNLSTDVRTKKLFNELNNKLENYKYKKDISDFDDEIKNDLNLFIEVVEQSK
jgi:polysaccharide pyruvyl transferase WcaK-like protein